MTPDDAISSTIHAFGDDELAQLDGVATAEAVRAGELHPTEVVAAAIARAEALEPHLRAIVTDDFARAVEAAAAAPTDGPFAGVPTFIKDQVDVAGLPTRYGSAAFDRAGPATGTAAVAEQLFAMGMIGLGKTSLPEFGFIPSAEFPDDDPTRNPWNTGHTAGGSSSGSAALVAAGVVPVAHGADGGGSIRIPAAACGLVGLKASRGRIVDSPDHDAMPVKIVVDGVLTRSVRDTALHLAEAEKRHRDPALPAVGHVTEPLTRRLRVALVEESPEAEVDAVNRREVERAAALLEDLGHHVERLEPPATTVFAEDFKHYWSMLAFAVTVGGRRLYGPDFDKAGLTDLTRGLARRFRRNLWRTPGAIRRLRRSTQAQAQAMAGFGVMLSPVVATLTPPIGHLSTELPFDVLFPRVERWVGFTPLANATGAPSISLPLGHDDETNLPVGILFTAAPGEDRLLLELALQLEAARPWRGPHH